MNIQRLRNLTTGLMHTSIGDIYEDLEFITGEPGIMTHMIPRVMRAVEPWLREKVTDERFWNGKHDPSHVGEFLLDAMTPEESQEALNRFAEMPNPLAGKEVIVVRVAD